MHMEVPYIYLLSISLGNVMFKRFRLRFASAALASKPYMLANLGGNEGSTFQEIAREIQMQSGYNLFLKA